MRRTMACSLAAIALFIGTTDHAKADTPPPPPPQSAAPADGSASVFTLSATGPAPDAPDKSNNVHQVNPRIAASGGYTITCTVSNDQPHASHHQVGTVNVEVHASCTSPVTSMTLTPYLYRPVPYTTVTGTSKTGLQNIDGNAGAPPCKNGNYQGYGYISVKFPPRFTPATGAGGRFGNVTYVGNC